MTDEPYPPVSLSPPTILSMPKDDRDILERAIQAIAERARDAYGLVEEAQATGVESVVQNAKRLRMELLQTKGELERELSRFVRHCKRCGLRVHWVSGVGPEPGHWAHGEPAPQHEPVIRS